MYLLAHLQCHLGCNRSSTYVQFSEFLPVLSVVNHVNYLERVHKSFIVLLSSFRCTEIELLERKKLFTFSFEVCRTNTHIVTWPFLTGCHQGINNGLMHYASIYAHLRKTCYNFCLLTHTNSNQINVTVLSHTCILAHTCKS